MYARQMIKKLTLALLFTLPSLSFAVDLDGFYITAKGGASKTFNTGTTNFVDDTGGLFSSENENLGTGTAFGFSVGKYLTDSFRLELEAIKRTGYEYDARDIGSPQFTDKAKMQTEALFINGFYDFQPFTMSNTAITPYLGSSSSAMYQIPINRNLIKTATQPDHYSTNAAITHNQVGADTHRESCQILRQLGQELNKIFLICRLKKIICRSTHTQPS